MMFEPTAQTSLAPKPHAALNDAVLPYEAGVKAPFWSSRIVPSHPPTAHAAVGVPHKPRRGADDGSATGDHAAPFQWMAVPAALSAQTSSFAVPHAVVSS